MKQLPEMVDWIMCIEGFPYEVGFLRGFSPVFAVSPCRGLP